MSAEPIRPDAPPLRLVPKRQMCLACQREKTGPSFKPGEDRCRKCVREGNEVIDFAPLVSKHKRMCIICAKHRGLACFEKKDGVTAECCDLCTSDPAVRITLKQIDAAAFAIHALRVVHTRREDSTPGSPTLGSDRLSEIAGEALRRIEEARDAR